jgi:hypothetical protein
MRAGVMMERTADASPRLEARIAGALAELSVFLSLLVMGLKRTEVERDGGCAARESAVERGETSHSNRPDVSA